MTKTWLPYDEYMKTINPNWIPREQYLKQQQAKREQYIEAMKKISMHYDSYLTLAKYADGCTQKYDKNMELGEATPSHRRSHRKGTLELHRWTKIPNEMRTRSCLRR